jgi:drug/metabolite transporter (DMT)-like permease
MATIVVVRGTWIAPGRWIATGALAGLTGLIGLAALYRGMAVGVVSIVAAIAATAPVIPVLAGLVFGERPGALQLAGIVLALVGVALLSFDRRPAAGRRVGPGVGLALLAALGFGAFLVALHDASKPDALWGVLATRAGSVATLVVLTLAVRHRPEVHRSDVAVLTTVGVLDISADVLYAVASTVGLLSLVSTLSSLYPVATILLARIFLGERVNRIQLGGIAVALTGVGMMSA